MANNYSSFLIALVCVAIILIPTDGVPIAFNDADRIQFALNLEFFEAEFFCYGANGRGLDTIAPAFAKGGPPPVGAKKANLDKTTHNIFEEFCYEEVGHLRAIITAYGGFSRPLYNLSSENFGAIIDKAVGQKLQPPFDPYSGSIQYLLASYAIPYVGLGGYVGTIPNLVNSTARRLASGLLGVEAGQDAVIRALLFQKADEKVKPYNITVAKFTNAMSELRNKLGGSGIKDEGIIVPKELGAEMKTETNVLSADANSLAYSRTPNEVLRIVYGTGSEYAPGGFLPRGGNGKIATSFLQKIY